MATLGVIMTAVLALQNDPLDSQSNQNQRCPCTTNLSHIDVRVGQTGHLEQKDCDTIGVKAYGKPSKCVKHIAKPEVARG